MDPKLVTPFVVGALVIWGIYRRLRRSFGRQRVSEGRMWFRIALLSVVGVLIVLSSARNLPGLGALLIGLLCGSALGYVGLKHTQFEVTAEGRFYTPHTYIGLTVTALFLGRLLYRFATLSAAGPVTPTDPNFLAAFHQNPLTLAIFAVLISYYVLFYVGVIRRTRPSAVSVPASAEQP